MIENERFILVIEELKRHGFIRNYSEIPKKIGRSGSLLTDIRKKKQKISTDILNSLKKFYPINVNYILFGKGEMLLESTSVEEKMKQMQEEIIRYHRIIDQLNYTIELQKEKLEAYKNQTSNSK